MKYYKLGNIAVNLEKVECFAQQGNQVEVYFEHSGTIIRVMQSEEEARDHYQAMLLTAEASYFVRKPEKPQLEQ